MSKNVRFPFGLMTRHAGDTIGRFRARLVPLLALLLVPTAISAVAAGPAAAAGAPHGGLAIAVLSGRADAIAGGQALVQIDGARAASAVVRLNGHVIRSVQPRVNGAVEGVVTGLRLGRNQLTATTPDGTGAEIEITNHPQQGPLVSGPHQEPFYCQNAANALAPPAGADCSAPAGFAFYYKSSQTGQFAAYDPGSPPADVATATVGGRTVPYIVRVESGVINRGVYRIAVLYNPAGPQWQPWAPQPGWAGKLDLEFGGGCGAGHVMGTLPDGSVLLDTPLSLGYAVASSSLMATATDCNLEVLAETAIMVKEHFTDVYGVPRFTMGDGCSGGSLSQIYVASAYPGILNGLDTQCSFVDISALQWQTQADCALLEQYYAAHPAGWTQAQLDAVEGRSTKACDVQYGAGTQLVYDPFYTGGWGCSPAVPASAAYDPVANPGGIRCSWQDDSVNLMGARPASVWTAAERALGHGFANRPIDNVGVEYGLAAYRAGKISLQQFVDLNAAIGGVDIDLNHTAARTQADPAAVLRAYRDGIVTPARNLASVPMINFASDDFSTAGGHEQQFTDAIRARLLAANGTAANEVIWRSNLNPGLTVTGHPLGNAAFRAMDQWLENITADRSHRPVQRKVIADKPAGLGDECFLGDQRASLTVCATQFPVQGTPRTAAGESLTMDVVKCDLVPLARAGYPGITDAEWAQLEQAFPTGVCDYGQPGRYRAPAVQWLNFDNGPDGQPSGPPPQSVPFRGTPRR